MLNRCHGNAESIEYYRNAIGFWPDSSVIQTVLTVDLVNERGATEKPKWLRTNASRELQADPSLSTEPHTQRSTDAWNTLALAEAAKRKSAP